MRRSVEQSYICVVAADREQNSNPRCWWISRNDGGGPIVSGESNHAKRHLLRKGNPPGPCPHPPPRPRQHSCGAVGDRPCTRRRRGAPDGCATGELRRQVADHLAARPGVEFTPRGIGLGLGGRSGGNAAEFLTSRGEAEQTSAKPVRYRATATTATAASAPAVPVGPPRPPRLAPPATPAPVAASAPTPAPVAGPSPTATGEAPVTGPVARPNRTLYHPRTLAGMPDVTALQSSAPPGWPCCTGRPGPGRPRSPRPRSRT